MRKNESEICEMRDELGYSFERIANKLGMSKQCANEIYLNSKGFTEKQFKLIESVKYKGIRNYLMANKIKLIDFCAMCDCGKTKKSAIRRFLNGEQDGNIYIIKKILEVTKMTFEEAFYEEKK